MELVTLQAMKERSKYVSRDETELSGEMLKEHLPILKKTDFQESQMNLSNI